MSGFEVVGVVLAVWPIMAQGVKFYSQGTDVVKDYLRYQHVLGRVVREMGRQQSMFRTSCERFMDDVANQCGVDEEEIAEMMLDPTDPRWREGNLVQEHIFSQESVQQFLGTVMDMNEELEKIKGLTAIYGDKDDPAPLGKKARLRHWKKVKLVVKKNDITRSLEEAGRLNTFLARLTAESQISTNTRRSSRRSIKHYSRIRSDAIDLYEILQDRFPTSPSCGCTLRHDVNMKLEFRSAKSTAKGLHFHTLFTSRIALPTQRNWREIETEPWRPKATNLCQDTENQTRVKFALDAPSAPATDYEDISDLCATIMGPASSREWLGSITSKRGQQHRIRAIDHEQKLLSPKSIETVSLIQVLRDKDFLQGQRCRLGLKLASSVMQLHTTEWLPDYWNKTDILFPRSLNATVDFDSPFIRRSFDTPSLDLVTISQNLPKLYLNAANPCLFSLGIVLLELWYREEFEHLKSEDERKLPLELSNLLAARRLANEMEPGPNYKNSVLRCISGLDAAYTSLGEGKLQAEVEEKIICPLEEDLKLYCNEKLIENCI